MVLELNASDRTGHRLIIWDESDAMTSAAQAGLRRFIKNYPSNGHFIMICHYPEKLIPAFRSRCTLL
jgi:DNA polymerase III delta prime subunit